MGDEPPTVIELGTDAPDPAIAKGRERVRNGPNSFHVEMGVEKAFDYNEYGLAEKLSEDDFSKLSEGDHALIDTPFEGAKVGEIKSVDSSWTGTMSATIDTGANKYEMTPYDDEFTEKYIATLDSKSTGEMTDNILTSLGKTTVSDVDVGSHVMLDVPEVGPTRGMVEQKRNTETQGVRVDVDTGPATFKVYEDPAGNVKKEMPYLVGKVPV